MQLNAGQNGMHIDWPKLWPQIGGSGVRTLICEQDNSTDWRRIARRSYTYRSRLAGAAAA